MCMVVPKVISVKLSSWKMFLSKYCVQVHCPGDNGKQKRKRKPQECEISAELFVSDHVGTDESNCR